MTTLAAAPPEFSQPPHRPRGRSPEELGFLHGFCALPMAPALQDDLEYLWGYALGESHDRELERATQG